MSLHQYKKKDTVARTEFLTDISVVQTDVIFRWNNGWNWRKSLEGTAKCSEHCFSSSFQISRSSFQRFVSYKRICLNNGRIPCRSCRKNSYRKWLDGVFFQWWSDGVTCVVGCSRADGPPNPDKIWTKGQCAVVHP